jgi:nifR3 family TIM-barrel protein
MFLGRLPIDPPLMLAPMAGVTNPPFRLTCARWGAPVCYSEMVSAEGLIRGDKKGLRLLRRLPGEAPLVIQLFGVSPNSMGEAARIVTDQGRAAALDVNLGCPARKVVKSGAGAALMRDPVLAGRVIAAVRQNTDLPLSVKIRSGWDHGRLNAAQIGLIAQDEGADAVIVHGRYAKQGFAGQADWEIIAAVKAALKVPVVGNGDVRSGQDAVDLIRRSGCDAVMIGRAARGDPWIFARAAARLSGREPEAVDPIQRAETALNHARLLAETVGARRAVFMLRAVLGWYSRGLPGATAFRSVINSSVSLELTLQAAGRFFSGGHFDIESMENRAALQTGSGEQIPAAPGT